jgi:hypothetical protein
LSEVTMNKLSVTLTRWRQRPEGRASGMEADSNAETVDAQPEPEMKSPEFQRRAARAMGRAPVAWYG